MGQINLFASTLSPAMRDFLSEYEDGKLQKVVIVRVLDETTYPHAYAVDDTIPHSFILIEINTPLINDDITWLYKGQVEKEWERSYPLKPGQSEREWERSVMLRYAIERVLNKPGVRVKRRKVESETEWDLVKDFRRYLEAPNMAFKHFKKHYHSGGYINVSRHAAGSILMIEYESSVFLNDDGRVTEA